MKNLKSRILLVGAPEKDIYGTLWNLNKLIYDYPDIPELKQLLSSNPDCAMVLDGLYSNQDEEYRDIRTLENLKKN